MSFAPATDNSVRTPRPMPNAWPYSSVIGVSRGSVLVPPTTGSRAVVDSSEAGLLTPADGERLRDALEPGTRPVGGILAPAQRMRTVDHTITPSRLERVAAEAGYSRFPVTGPEGAVLGYLHIKDTLGVADRDRPFPAGALHPITRVRIDTPLDGTLTALRAQGSQLAAVLGEGGKVIGFVPMEDVLSELVGPAPAAA